MYHMKYKYHKSCHRDSVLDYSVTFKFKDCKNLVKHALITLKLDYLQNLNHNFYVE